MFDTINITELITEKMSSQEAKDTLTELRVFGVIAREECESLIE